jgi:hypothetical protein
VSAATDLLPSADKDAVLDHITRQIQRVAACLPGLMAPALAPSPATGMEDVPGDELAEDEDAAGPA